MNIYGKQLHPNFSEELEEKELEEKSDTSEEQILVEALISPDSRMSGRDLEETRFRKLTNCIVLGIKRTSRIFREQITDIVLEPGDVLLVQGTKNAVENLKTSRDVILLDYTTCLLYTSDAADE